MNAKFCRTLCVVLIPLHPQQHLNSRPASWGFSFPLQWGALWWPCWRERRSWVLQWNTREAAPLWWYFRCADQSSNHRASGLLPPTVWKVVLFGKWYFIVIGTGNVILSLPLESLIWEFPNAGIEKVSSSLVQSQRVNHLSEPVVDHFYSQPSQP